MTTNINIDASAYVKKTDLPSNLTLYPTTTASDIATYFKLVTEIADPDYDNPAVDVATGAITGSNQLISSLATSAGILTGNPGIFTVSTVGNIRRTSGSGEAEFYFEIYQRNASGTETLIATSNATSSVSNTTYEQFNASALFNNGTFLPTDRIVLKFYGSKVGGGSDPSYQFQFGGAEPVRTIVPVPASVLLDVPIQVGVTEIVGGDEHQILFHDTSDTVQESADLTWNDSTKILSVGGEVVNDIDRWTIELIDALTVDFYAPFSMSIDTVTNILNSPTITILDDDSAYTLGNTIATGSKITVTADTASVVSLKSTRI